MTVIAMQVSRMAYIRSYRSHMLLILAADSDGTAYIGNRVCRSAMSFFIHVAVYGDGNTAVEKDLHRSAMSLIIAANIDGNASNAFIAQ